MPTPRRSPTLTRGCTGRRQTPQRGLTRHGSRGRLLSSMRDIFKVPADSLADSPTLDRTDSMAQPTSNRPSPVHRTSDAHRALTKALLVLEGGNPEDIIYEALFTSTATLRESAPDDRGGLTPPTRPDWQAAWTAMSRGFNSATATRINLSHIAALVSRRVVTADEGVIRLLLIAGLLIRREDVVLYENSNLVATLSSKVATRISDNISSFSVKNTQAGDGQRSVLLEILGRRLQLPPPGAGGSRLLEVTMTLYRHLKAMPPYTQQTTRFISRDTLAIRQCFRGASEPDVLLFETLPVVLMIEPFSGSGTVSSVKAGEYTTGLFKAIRELQAALPALLECIQRILAQAASSNTISLHELREDLTAKAQMAGYREMDPELKPFILALNSSGSDEQWLEAVASVAAGGRSPREWTDDRLDCYLAQIEHLGSTFCQELKAQ